MQINTEKCTGCGSCTIYCPVNAINHKEETAEINLNDCVECGTCYRIKICPVDAIYQQKLEWPRILRSVFSDPNSLHKLTNFGGYGRGTPEMKSNDVTNRYKLGTVGLAIEMGRPSIGTTFEEIEKITLEIAKMGVDFEKGNSLTSLMDISSGKLHSDILGERVLSAIVEFIVPTEQIKDVLDRISDIYKEIDTVFSLAMVTRVGLDGELPNVEIVKKLGYWVSPNAKVNVGLGRIVE